MSRGIFSSLVRPFNIQCSGKFQEGNIGKRNKFDRFSHESVETARQYIIQYASNWTGYYNQMKNMFGFQNPYQKMQLESNLFAMVYNRLKMHRYHLMILRSSNRITPDIESTCTSLTIDVFFVRVFAWVKDTSRLGRPMCKEELSRIQ